jgi:peptidoglycan-binding protein ArfA
VIRGRTDDQGPLAVNERLAFLRAVAVKNHLLARKALHHDNIVIDAKGTCCYAVDNRSEKERALNRRVEVEFIING